MSVEVLDDWQVRPGDKMCWSDRPPESFAVHMIITAVPGCDTPRQNTLDGASIDVCEYFGVHAASLASAERRELSSCVCDHIHMNQLKLEELTSLNDFKAMPNDLNAANSGCTCLNVWNVWILFLYFWH